MANSRMFSKSVVQSARFLRLSVEARLLYYDLGMAADDDGYVEAFTVLRMTDAVESVLRELETAGFVRVLNDDLVTWITDWLENNHIRRDRKKDSIYAGAFPQVKVDNLPTAIGCQDDNQVVPQIRGSESKEFILDGGREQQSRIPSTVQEVKAFCDEAHIALDADKFFNYYSSTGWKKTSGRDILDWRAEVRLWAIRDAERGKVQRANGPVMTETRPEPTGKDYTSWISDIDPETGLPYGQSV